MSAVTGISDHIGWAECVTIRWTDAGPAIVERRREELIDAGVPSAPYHHEGLALPIDEVQPLLARTRASVTAQCRRVVQRLRDELGVTAVVLQESPFPALPASLADVLVSYALTCAADGMLYREELATQAASAGLTVHRTARRTDPVAIAATVAGVTAAQVTAWLDAFGREVGAPWRKEHRTAAASALAVFG